MFHEKEIRLWKIAQFVSSDRKNINIISNSTERAKIARLAEDVTLFYLLHEGKAVAKVSFKS